MAKASTEYKKNHKSNFGHEKIEILYEDEDIIVICKPEGMLSVPYPGSHARTALETLEQIMRKKGSYSASHRPFVVHRLDRETSGVMMFALSEAAQKKIMDNWQKMVTERIYHAVGENPKEGFLPDSGIIDDELAYNAHNIGFVPKNGDRPSDNNATRRAIQNSRNNNSVNTDKSIYERNLTVKNGKAEFKTITARTHYKVLARGKFHTLFELSLDTGRKNQIRAHLASRGYPLAGDENYRAKTDPFGRMALHARTLEFNHPYTHEHMKFEVPEPKEWLETVENGHGNVRAMWAQDRHPGENRNQNSKKEDIYRLAEAHSRPSGKKIAGMDFISRGKLHK